LRAWPKTSEVWEAAYLKSIEAKTTTV